MEDFYKRLLLKWHYFNSFLKITTQIYTYVFKEIYIEEKLILFIEMHWIINMY